MLKEMKLKLADHRRVMQRLRSRRDADKYGEIRLEYLRILEKQEVYWHQRAKQYWL